ncbi:MAG TPA: MarR family transcriptional regulator [Euzebyales bacterium]|nr:MarR family transcriptional regulator [Euzebyales bacterium]
MGADAHSTGDQARDELERSANLLGALALAIGDRRADAVAEAAGHSRTGATALSALHHFLDAPSIDRLRQVLGLTPSGTVRLVDRLEQDGYVTRGAGDDRRSRAVTLTARGREVARRVSAARAQVLDDALARLSDDERACFGELTGKVLAGLMREPGAVRWTCRLCDVGICRSEPGECPFAAEARRRYGVDLRARSAR